MFFMPIDRIFIFANGELLHPELLKPLLRPDDFLIAADGGLHHILKIGRAPNLLLGDLDSVTPDEIHTLQDSGVPVKKFPREKDETDLELALDYAIKAGAQAIRIVGALGARLDHTLGNLFLLTQPDLATKDIRLEDGETEVFIVHQETIIEGLPGDLVSLVPLLGPVRGVETHLLQYPLKQETLFPTKTRGISNVMLSSSAAVRLASGTLLCIHTRNSLPDKQV
jgi:thiamine pyrophosphokinase